MVDAKLAKHRIHETVNCVPLGYVVSYGQLADLAGLPGRARMVGKLLSSDESTPLPWHRVLRADGKIAFPPASHFAQLQRDKLQEEGVAVINFGVNMRMFQWQPDLAELLHRLKF
ncbi:MGMT family protein [Aestuariibacter sp. AA17]|uniref:MGMT family protein n=1 Tax=Fluctibacter corallii TaxID=2984329 RepID=A0ABT3AC95_9ALTE|nr:MGMT family protein [Aestuariibacter sp. AA17]MCV2885907.1 MGMT family protein [Aestuariibacter sp. AA17]